MESVLVDRLSPRFDPVAVVWSGHCPADAVRFKPGRFGCVLYLFAEASTRGRVAAASQDRIACPAGRASLGFGVEFDASEAQLDQYAALFSKGLPAARDQAAYRACMDSTPKQWREMFEFGERRHSTHALAEAWLLNGLPRYDAPQPHVLFKPLRGVGADEDVRAVIFPVTPLELSGLVTLAGAVLPGTDPVQVPQGPDCAGITAFACAQDDRAEPRAVLGMMGLDGRELMRRRFADDVLTLTVPMPLFRRMEAEADDSVLRLPSWERLVRPRGAA